MVEFSLRNLSLNTAKSAPIRSAAAAGAQTAPVEVAVHGALDQAGFDAPARDLAPDLLEAAAAVPSAPGRRLGGRCGRPPRPGLLRCSHVDRSDGALRSAGAGVDGAGGSAARSRAPAAL